MALLVDVVDDLVILTAICALFLMRMQQHLAHAFLLGQLRRRIIVGVWVINAIHWVTMYPRYCLLPLLEAPWILVVHDCNLHVSLLLRNAWWMIQGEFWHYELLLSTAVFESLVGLKVLCEVVIIVAMRGVVAVGLGMRKYFDWDWLRCRTHPIRYIHVWVLLDVPNVLSSFLLFLIKWHDGDRNFAFCAAAFQLC